MREGWIKRKELQFPLQRDEVNTMALLESHFDGLTISLEVVIRYTGVLNGWSSNFCHGLSTIRNVCWGWRADKAPNGR